MSISFVALEQFPHLLRNAPSSLSWLPTCRNTQPGHQTAPLTEGDILESSEVFRQQMDYFAHSPDTRLHITRLAALQPGTLACMHGSAWRGDGAMMLMRLADRLNPA